MENQKLQMNNLQTSYQKLEETTRIFNIQTSIAVALERTLTTPYDITNMVSDIQSEFSKVPDNIIQQAIKKGSLGEFGQTYKLSTQTVCIWIREYCRNKGIIYSKTNQI